MAFESFKDESLRVIEQLPDMGKSAISGDFRLLSEGPS